MGSKLQAPPARVREVAKRPLRQDDGVGCLGQRLQRQLDLVLLPDARIVLARLDVAHFAVAVLDRHADLRERDHRPAPELLAEDEGRAGVVASLAGAVDVTLLRMLAEEVLDLAERQQLDAGLGHEAVRRAARTSSSSIPPPSKTKTYPKLDTRGPKPESKRT